VSHACSPWRKWRNKLTPQKASRWNALTIFTEGILNWKMKENLAHELERRMRHGKKK